MDTPVQDNTGLNHGEAVTASAVIQIAAMIEAKMPHAPTELKVATFNAVIHILWPNIP